MWSVAVLCLNTLGNSAKALASGSAWSNLEQTLMSFSDVLKGLVTELVGMVAVNVVISERLVLKAERSAKSSGKSLKVIKACASTRSRSFTVFLT